MSFSSASTKEKIGFFLVRVLVPLWVLGGATMKLISKTPKLLPQEIWQTAFQNGMDLYVLLFVLVGLEFFAVAVMVLMPRFSRFMAGWMLSIFVLVLINEIAHGNTKCGCLGSFSPSPWVMLAIDATLLVLVLVFKPWRETDRVFPVGRTIATAVLTLIGFGVTAAVILPERGTTRIEVPVDGDTEGSGSSDVASGADGSGGETRAPAARELPPYYAIPDTQAWVGQRFLDTDLAGFVQGWPEGLETGPNYVIFFSRSCDHCQQLLEAHFAGQPPVATTLVAIPETKGGFREGSWIDMNYCDTCVTQLEMPVGVDYLMTPPVVVALAEGEIVCAAEADDAVAPECLVFGM